MKRQLTALLCVAGLAWGADPPAGADVMLRAMKDELDRSKTLAIASLDAPYYVQYTVDEVRSFSVSATLGGVYSRNENHARIPRIRVRVGDYNFDNTNYVYSDFYSGSRYDPDRLPLDDNYGVLRRAFWLGTDRAYKAGVEAIARKRAALRNITVTDQLPDFWKAQPTVKIVQGSSAFTGQDAWTNKVKSLSGLFQNYPAVLSSVVSFDGTRSVFYMHNSEGSMMRIPDSLYTVQARAFGQAADGMTVRDALILPTVTVEQMPDDARLRAAVTRVADNVKALAAAPLGDSYSGPVLFEGIAAAQLFAEALGQHLSLTRKPLGEPGRAAPFQASELEGRIGSRILPEFMDVVDDPTQSSWNNLPLFGQYDIDEEGVVPTPVTLVEKGRLKSFLLTRQPVKGFAASNGRARMPGAYGANRSSFSNLFVRAVENVKAAELKQKLIQMCKDREKPYGMIIRKMDYPSTASNEELRRVMNAAAQSGGSSRPMSIPLLAYRVYPDGREELVRGLRFRGLSVRSLKDIAAASDDNHVFSFMNNGAIFALAGAGGYFAPSSVIAPSVLFEDLELEKPQDDMPRLPVVPPPALSATR